MTSNSVSFRRSWRFFAAALVAALALGLSQPSQRAIRRPFRRAQSPLPARPNGRRPGSAALRPAAPVASIAAAGPQGGEGSINQGVKMHGHWVIDVKNPDGSLVEHRDFENSLESSAQGMLIGLMSGRSDARRLHDRDGAAERQWRLHGYLPVLRYRAISLDLSGRRLLRQLLLRHGIDRHAQSRQRRLSSGPFSLVLAGSITANQTGTIGSVYSLISTCANIAYSGHVNPSTIETSSPVHLRDYKPRLNHGMAR